MKGEDALLEPAARWVVASKDPQLALKNRLRLAAMAGHMAGEIVAARRAALIDLLADGRPRTREAIWSLIESQLGRPCWGQRPEETLQRDLRALRRGGLRIAYSRRKGVEGYYLQHPALQRPQPAVDEAIDWRWIAALRKRPVNEKNQMASDLAAFALKQRRLLLAQEHPDWSADSITAEAQRQVFPPRRPAWIDEAGRGMNDETSSSKLTTGGLVQAA
jgi:hypothetical protein